MHSNLRAPGGNAVAIQVRSKIRVCLVETMFFPFEFQSGGAWGDRVGICIQIRVSGGMHWEFKLDSNSNPRATGRNQPGFQIQIRMRLGEMNWVFKLYLNSRAPRWKRDGNLNAIRIQIRGCLGKMEWKCQSHSNSRMPEGK